MTQDEAKSIIEHEPVGVANFYSKSNGMFYMRVAGSWYVFSGEWVSSQKPKCMLKPTHEILAIALGDEK